MYIEKINGPEDVKKKACRGNAPCAFDSCK